MAKKKPEPEAEEKPKEDSFVMLLQGTIEDMLKEGEVAYKDRVALIANAIKFLQVKFKVSENDGGSIFDDD